MRKRTITITLWELTPKQWMVLDAIFVCIYVAILILSWGKPSSVATYLCVVGALLFASLFWSKWCELRQEKEEVTSANSDDPRSQ